MFTIWGYWPTGTNNGLVGFRAGIANHYSENAMYIVTTLIIVISTGGTRPIEKNGNKYYK